MENFENFGRWSDYRARQFWDAVGKLRFCFKWEIRMLIRKNCLCLVERTKKPISFEHVSTVGGLAFDMKANRLAVAHYGGATIWENTQRKWKSSKLIWKGSHGATSFSPDGKYLVTVMQENAVHGWRLRDKADLAMSGLSGKDKELCVGR